MDGASKFVKGDAMAAVIITAINLIGGIVVGMLQHGLSLRAKRPSTYSLLTVGDGLAAQIPALLISVATGIIVTRAASDRDLGSDIAGQILGQRKAPLVAAGAIGLFALIPGLPKLPFLLIAGDLRRDRLGACATACPARKDARQPPRQPRERRAAGAAATSRSARSASTRSSSRSASASCRSSTAARGGSLLRRVSMIRRQIAGELGLVIPPVRIHDELGLESHEYVLKVRGSEVARGRIMPGHLLAMDPGDASRDAAGHPHARARLRPRRGVGARVRRAPRPRRSATRSSTPSR